MLLLEVQIKIHEKNVSDIFTKLYEKGEIYKGSYKGMYCVPCEAFWTESQLVEGNKMSRLW